MAERSGFNWLNLALLVAGGYVVVRYVLPLFQTVAQGASAATGAVSSGIANAYLAATLPPPIQVNTASRGVNMPDGSVVPLGAFQGVGADPSSTFLVGSYNGTRYNISGPLDAAGNYTGSPA